MGVCNCSMFCCMLLCVRSSIAIILMGKRELVALLSLSSWCLVVVGRLFLAVPRGCLRFVIVVFPDHTYLLFSIGQTGQNYPFNHFQCNHLAYNYNTDQTVCIILEKLSNPSISTFVLGVQKNSLPGDSSREHP